MIFVTAAVTALKPATSTDRQFIYCKSRFRIFFELRGNPKKTEGVLQNSAEILFSGSGLLHSVTKNIAYEPSVARYSAPLIFPYKQAFQQSNSFPAWLPACVSNKHSNLKFYL
jgi:hypothetical protein